MKHFWTCILKKLDDIFGTTAYEQYKPYETETTLNEDYQTIDNVSKTTETVSFLDGQQHVPLNKKIRFEDQDNQSFTLSVSRDITEIKEIENLVIDILRLTQVKHAKENMT